QVGVAAKPNMWSNDRFSIIKTTMCLRLLKPTGRGTTEPAEEVAFFSLGNRTPSPMSARNANKPLCLDPGNRIVSPMSANVSKPPILRFVISTTNPKTPNYRSAETQRQIQSDKTKGHPP